MSKTSITSGQEKQFGRSAEDAARFGVDLALRKVPLDVDGMQRVLGHGREIRTAIARVIVDKTREFARPNQFAGEEVRSLSTYPSGYAARTLEVQTRMLCDLFPRLSLGMDYADHVIYLESFPWKVKLYAGAERLFIIPRWQKVASTYSEALEIALALLARSRTFHNYCHGSQLSENCLRQSDRTSAMLDELAASQPGDFIILPAQLGFLHRGRSMRRAREIFDLNEFGLDSFTVASILLTHPQRLVAFNDLWIDCAGDEFKPAADDSVFNYAPGFTFGDGKLGFTASTIKEFRAHYGSASGFLM